MTKAGKLIHFANKPAIPKIRVDKLIAIRSRFNGVTI